MRRFLSLIWLFTCTSVFAQPVVLPPQLFPIDIAAFKRLPVSTVTYLTTLRAFNALGPASTAQAGTAGDQFDTILRERHRTAASTGESLHRFSPWTDAIITPSLNLSDDAPQDVEPSVVTQTISGTFTATTYIRVSGPSPRNYFITTNDSTRSVVAGGPLPMPRIIDGWQGASDAAYLETADPIMAESLSSGGVAGRRVYAAG